MPSRTPTGRWRLAPSPCCEVQAYVYAARRAAAALARVVGKPDQASALGRREGRSTGRRHFSGRREIVMIKVESKNADVWMQNDVFGLK